MSTFDLNSDEIIKSVAETMICCAFQPVLSWVEMAPDLGRRSNPLREAKELSLRLDADQKRLWNRLRRRDITKTFEWKRMHELLHEANQICIAPLPELLRTVALKPIRSLGEARTEQERESLVRSVILRRSELLRTTGKTLSPFVDVGQSEGRMLIYVPIENLADGAAEIGSKGFFDVDNIPPWDTWVAYSDHTLLSWVPAQLVPIVQRGIDVNPEECIRWMS